MHHPSMKWPKANEVGRRTKRINAISTKKTRRIGEETRKREEAHRPKNKK